MSSRVHHRRVAAAIAVALLALAACGDDGSDAAGEPPTSDDLDGGTFTSTSVSGAELAPDAQLVVAFEDGQVAITGGCNNIFGAYEIDGSTFVAPQLGSTMMACEPPALMDQDTWVIEFMSGSPTVALDGDDLTFSNDTITIELTR